MVEKYFNDVKKFYKKHQKVISGLVYVLMVFVVVYGISQDVYAGFPIVVPYIVMLIFMIMAFARLYQWLMKVSFDKKSDSPDDDEKK